MKYIVYKTTCLVNDKIYIGVHKTEDPLIFDGYLGRGFFIGSTHYLEFPIAPFHHALVKYGVANFQREILYVFDTEEEAYQKESEIVTEEFINSGKTYNVSLGGKGRPRPTIPVHQFDVNGTLVKSYSSALEASKSIERSISNIYSAINDKRICAGYLWSYNSIIELSDYTININNNYYLYNTDGFLIEEFNSLSEIVAFLGTNNGNITRAVKANYKISGYFMSTEKYDKIQIVVSKNSEQLNRYTIDGTYIDSFKTVSEAKQKLGLKLSSISAAIKLNRTCNGFRWTRNDNPPMKLDIID